MIMGKNISSQKKITLSLRSEKVSGINVKQAEAELLCKKLNNANDKFKNEGAGCL